jgi:hypothetical protein
VVKGGGLGRCIEAMQACGSASSLVPVGRPSAHGSSLALGLSWFLYAGARDLDNGLMVVVSFFGCEGGDEAGGR